MPVGSFVSTVDASRQSCNYSRCQHLVRKACGDAARQLYDQVVISVDNMRFCAEEMKRNHKEYHIVNVNSQGTVNKTFAQCLLE